MPLPSAVERHVGGYSSDDYLAYKLGRDRLMVFEK